MKIKFYQTFGTQIEITPRITIIYAKGIGFEWLWFGLMINWGKKNED